MKKVLLASLTILMVGVLTYTQNTLTQGIETQETMAQEALQISPKVWVLGAKASEVITAHAAFSHSIAEEGLIELSVINGSSIEEITEFNTFPDSKEELVIKFSPDMKKYVVGDEPTVSVKISTVDGKTTEGTVVFEDTAKVQVK